MKHKTLIIVLLTILVIFLLGSCLAGSIATYYFITDSLTGKSCTVSGVTYKNGESFPAGDGCNSCSCDNGQAACTLMACLPPDQTPPVYPTTSTSSNLTNTWTNSLPYPNNYILTTPDWKTFSPANKSTKFMLNYPEDWMDVRLEGNPGSKENASQQNNYQTQSFELKDQLITEFEGVKVAEIMGLVSPSPAQSCFQNLSQNQAEFVSQKKINTGKFSGVVRYEKISLPERSSELPTLTSRYCLDVGTNQFFLMNFYGKNDVEMGIDQTLIYQILNSFKLQID